MNGERRRVLAGLTAAVAVVGMIAATIPFASSLQPSARAKDNAYRVVDASQIQPGQILDLGPIRVYRRTPADFESYIYSSVHHFDNPLSKPLPKEAQNELRSAHPEYFVYRPYTVRRGCDAVYYRKADGDPKVWRHNDLSNVYPRFWDMCEGTIFDTTGRALGVEYLPLEGDLTVPPTEVLHVNGLVYLRVHLVPT